MKKALNQQNQLINILESEKDELYSCPICGETLYRKFGKVNQFFAHPSGKGKECELKLKKMEEMKERELDLTKQNILKEFYDKKFDNIEIIFSNEKNEEGYNFTQEQIDIINSKEDKIIVSALAGSGKSNTLYYYAKKRPSKKMLYIVYNKAMKEEADKTFGKLNNVEVRTIHSLAYSKIIDSQYRRKLTFNYSIIDIINDLGLNKRKDMQLASQINLYLNEYRLSNKINIHDVEPEELKNLKDNTRKKVIRLTEMLWNMKKDKNSNVKITHDFYLKMFHLSKLDLSNKYNSILLDECLPKSQKIKTNRGIISIKTIYDNFINNKELPLVLSYNKEHDKFEFKKITSAMKSENREILEIKTEGLNVLHCTPNHKVLTQRGWIMASEIKIGTDLLILDKPNNQKTKYKLNEKQRQIVLGSFLGDGSLHKTGKFNNFRLKFTQGEKQFDYFKEKISYFNLPYKKIKSGYTNKLNIYQSNYTKMFLLENNIWEELKTISAFGLAIWYQDDGSFTKHTKNNGCVTINSNALTKQQTLYMIDILKKQFNLNAKIKMYKNKYYYISFNTKESNIFLKIVSKYMHPSLQYKTNINISNNKNTPLEKDRLYLNHGGNYIKSVKSIGHETVYDIEVEDNHNFVTTRTNTKKNQEPTGIVVHNCQDSNLLTLDCLENSKVKNIVMVGDELQSLYKWRKSINIMEYFNYDREYKLTTSFRVSQNIAQLSNYIIKDLYDKNINMKGFNNKQKIVDKIDTNNKFACLCRTNAGILQKAIDYNHKNIYFEGGFNSYRFNDIADAYYFSIGKKIKNTKFCKFKNYEEMKEYAEEVEDIELLSIIKVIRDYGSNIIPSIQKIKSNKATNKENCDIILSTIHKSKGQTFKIPLLINNDHYDLHDYKKDLALNKNLFEDMCIIYVAITRCANKIELSNSIKNYLSNKLKNN